jgi:hypothetical protein
LAVGLSANGGGSSWTTQFISAFHPLRTFRVRYPFGASPSDISAHQSLPAQG